MLLDGGVLDKVEEEEARTRIVLEVEDCVDRHWAVSGSVGPIIASDIETTIDNKGGEVGVVWVG